MSMRDWSVITSDYRQSLRRRGRAEGTVRSYDWAFRDFDRYLKGISRGPLALTAEELGHWQDSLIDRGMAPRTQQLAVCAVRNALHWAENRGSEFDQTHVWEVLEAPKAPRLLPKPLPPPVVERITTYLAPRRPKADLLFYRVRAMWFYMVSTGARVSEVLSLDTDDLAQEGPIVRQKGGSQKTLYAPPVAMGAVADYLRLRHDDCPALWVTCGNPPVRRLDPAGVREQWHRLADYLGVPRWTTHQLRHTCATELLDAGVPPEVVAAHLGHHGLASLAGYGEVRLGRRRLAVAAMEERLGALKPQGQKFVVVKGGGGRRVELV